MCAMPSETLFLTFFRARAADAAGFWDGDCAIRCFLSGLRRGRLVERDLLRLARAFAGARVGARTLAADRQALAVPHAPVAAEVHQPLDAHRDLAPQVALDRVAGHELAQLVHLRVGEVLDLRGVLHLTRVADLPRARPADAIDRRQRDLGVLVVRDIDACYAGHRLASTPCG